MFQNRAIKTIKKPIIVLNKSSELYSELGIGDDGQALIKGIIIAEKINPDEDDTEFITKTIKIVSLELIKDKKEK